MRQGYMCRNVYSKLALKRCLVNAIEKTCCGLCGKTENLIKTPCCNNWICDDAHEYVLFSYDTNSCFRNHDRYTLCSYHHKENHQGKWQNCKQCKEDFQIEAYVDFGTNAFNFERLKNPPKVEIRCTNCGFISHTTQDFAYQTSRGWFCVKNKCQKAAMKI